MSKYDSLNDKEKLKIITDLYVDESKSFQAIAKQFDTYTNKILRDAKRLHVPIRSKSQAQKNALEKGVHKHPTKGKQRSQEEKHKIGTKILQNWEKADQKTKDEKRAKSKILWEQKSEEQKADMLAKANDAVRNSSKVGSKLEHFILQELIKDGYKVEFHKEQVLANTKLQIDLFLPTMNIAIEVDGPSHFLPVWGQDVLDRNRKYDQKKSGLIIGRGWKLVRVKQTNDFSNSRSLMLYHKLIEAINTINKSSTTSIEIEDK